MRRRCQGPILETNISFFDTGMSFLREGWDMFNHRLCLCKVDSDFLPKKTSRPTPNTPNPVSHSSWNGHKMGSPQCPKHSNQIMISHFMSSLHPHWPIGSIPPFLSAKSPSLQLYISCCMLFYYNLYISIKSPVANMSPFI